MEVIDYETPESWGVETAERLVENQEGGLVQNGGDELHLLLHTL